MKYQLIDLSASNTGTSCGIYDTADEARLALQNIIPKVHIMTEEKLFEGISYIKLESLFCIVEIKEYEE